MDTSRLNEVKTPQHAGTPRSLLLERGGPLDVLGLLAELAHHGLVSTIQKIGELEDVRGVRLQHFVDDGHVLLAELFP